MKLQHVSLQQFSENQLQKCWTLTAHAVPFREKGDVFVGHGSHHPKDTRTKAPWDEKKLNFILVFCGLCTNIPYSRRTRTKVVRARFKLATEQLRNETHDQLSQRATHYLHSHCVHSPLLQCQMERQWSVCERWHDVHQSEDAGVLLLQENTVSISKHIKQKHIRNTFHAETSVQHFTGRSKWPHHTIWF